MRSFKKTLDIYNKLKKDRDKFPNFFFLQSQNLFEIIRTEKKNLNHTTVNKFFGTKRIVTFLVNLLFLFRSIITFIKLILIKKSIAHYQICINNSTEFYYDKRSKYIIDELPQNKIYNILVVNDLTYGLKTFFKYKNPIYYLQIKYFLSFFIKKKNKQKTFENISRGLKNIISKKSIELYSRLICETELIVRFFAFFFRVIKTKKIYMIDDTRYCNEILEASKNLNITTYAYQQGRINQYHVGIGENCFDNFILWNKYSLKKLIHLNKNYSKKKLFIIGYPLIKKKININEKSHNHQKKNLLIVAETSVDYKNLYGYFNKIFKTNNFNVFLREKKGQVISKSLYKYKNYKKFKIDDNSDLFISLKKNKIDLVVGTLSTILLESWIIGVPSIVIKINFDYGSHLYEDGLVDLVENVNDVNRVIKKNLNLTKQEIATRRNLIWDDNFAFNRTKLRMGLDI